MIRLAALLLWILAPSPLLAADPIALRSGEHARFSRLVLPLPAGAEWTLEQDGRKADLVLGLPDVAFDTSQVFQRIPRTRLLDVTQNGQGVLSLHLDCDCIVTGFTQGAAYLVIDISDPKPGVLPPLALAQPAIRPAYRFRFPPGLSPGFSNVRDIGSSQTDDMVREMVVDMLLPETGEDLVRSDLVNASERRLVEQIGRAVGQGLLDLPSPPAPDATRDSPTRPPQDPRAMNTDPAPAAEATRLTGLDHGNVAVATAFDRDRSRLDLSAAGRDPGGLCAESDLYDLASWGDGKPFATQIGQLRSELFSDVDRVEPGHVLKLARVYLHHGFGAEARQVLSLAPDHAPGHAAARALADIVDDKPATADNPFVGIAGCDGDAAMWAVLADPDASGINGAAVQRAFARLPAHLRIHLGPLLADRLAGTGDRETSEAVLRAVTRTGSADDAAVGLAEATIAGLRNDTPAATANLETVAGSGTGQAPIALIRLIETSWRDRSAVAADLPDLVAAYALEFRHAEFGADLRRVHSLALALNARFDEAMAMAENLGRIDGPAARTDAVLSVLSLITDRAGDMDFLRYALPVANDPPADLPERLGDKAARRLLDLGFAKAALSVLETSGTGAASASRRLIRSEAALSVGLPHRALVELLGLDTPEAGRLRASALSRIGEYRQAGQMLESEDPDAAAREYWLSGETGPIEQGAGAPETDTTKYQTIAQLTARLGGQEDPGDTTTSLAQARSLIADSAAVRKDIGILLDSVGPGQDRTGEARTSPEPRADDNDFATARP